MSLCNNLKVRTQESSTYGSFHNLHFLELKFFKLHIITFYIWFPYSCIMIHAYQIALESNAKTCLNMLICAMVVSLVDYYF